MIQGEFDKLLRDAGTMINATEFVVIGSTSILGSFKAKLLNNPMLMSVETDVIVLGSGTQSEALESYAGAGSQYHQTFGVYADVVSLVTPSTAPDGWLNRLVPYSVPDSDVTAFCMHPADLWVTKLLVGRHKDKLFVEEQASRSMVIKGDIALGGLSASQIATVGGAVERLGVPDNGFTPVAVNDTSPSQEGLAAAWHQVSESETERAHYATLSELIRQDTPICGKAALNGLPCANHPKNCNLH